MFPQPDLRETARSLAASLSRGSFRFAIKIHEVYRLGAYHEWGFETFAEYVAAEMPSTRIEYAKGLVKTADKLDRLGLLHENGIEDLGLSKVRVVARAPNGRTARVLLELAKVPGVTVEDLDKHLKAEKAREQSAEDGDLVRFAVLLTREQHDILQRAMEVVGEAARTLSPARQIEMIAAEALATWAVAEYAR